MQILRSYYRDQLARIEPGKAGTSAAKVKITHDGKATNWLDLNADTAKVLRKWLDKHYPV